MAISYVHSWSEYVTSATSISLSKPTGLAVDDFIGVFIVNYAAGAGDAWSVPTGWTRIAPISGPINLNGVFFHKVADSSDVAASTFTFNTTGSGGSLDYVGGIIAAYRGVDTINPIAGQSTDSGTEVSVTSYDLPSVTTYVDGCELLAFSGNRLSGGEHPDVANPPTGYAATQYSISSNEADPYMFTKTQSAAGSTGPVSVNLTGTDGQFWVGGHIALRPAGASGGNIIPLLKQLMV